MTPGARAAAAIDILDQWMAGAGLEKALTQWARANRFAGSSDRAAIRDLCYDVARRKRSSAWLGGGTSGRALVIGHLRATGQDVDELFTGQGYAPPALANDERTVTPLDDAPLPVRHDCPDWLWDHYETYEPNRARLLDLMKSRAPIFLRVNLLRASVQTAMAELAKDDIATEPHPLARTALLVTTNERRVQQSHAFKSGLVELQDSASQAVVEFLDLEPGQNVLDYCAGGGGKTLAVAALTKNIVWAHDANPGRMNNLPSRAQRAGADVSVVPHHDDIKDKFDVVICDAPCSGSGSWRRDPEGKWALTPAGLSKLNMVQLEILHRASALVRPGGQLAYATCSVFSDENENIVADFMEQQPKATLIKKHQFLPFDGGDGFFISHLKVA